MIRKTISFTDLDGNEVTEEFHFHMSVADLAEFMLDKGEDFVEHIKELTAKDDRKGLFQVFKQLLTASVGRRSEDGRKFLKSQETTDDFMSSDAFSEFLLELHETGKAIEFWNGIMPSDLEKKVAKLEAANANDKTEFSLTEMLAMTQAEFDKNFGTDPKKWSGDVMMAAYQRKSAA